MSERIPYSSCPLCNTDMIVQYRVGNCAHHPLYVPVISPDIMWMACTKCSHVFTDGFYSAEIEAIVFSATLQHQKLGVDLESQRPIAARMVDRVTAFVDSGKWLDIGFGNGSLLFTAKEYGFIPYGCDMRQANVAALEAMGIRGHCGNFSDLSDEGPFKVISMMDVLEHIPYPKPALQAAHKMIDYDGVLFISMPNSESPVWGMLDRAGANPYWGELEHYHNFSRSRLYTLLQECGFEPLRYGVSERYRCCMEVTASKSR